MSDSESRTLSTVLLAAARRGAWLLRNNSGAWKDESGRLIRYGLGNISAQFNRTCKSSDLIGIEPVLVTPDMVGSVIGRFVARECKPEGWRFTGTEREVAQQRFIDKVNELGGDGRFTTGEYK